MIGFYICVVDLFLVCCLAIVAAGVAGWLLLRHYPQQTLYWVLWVRRLLSW